jgi:pimeloyl-ACP methyl ester carboxylesterase
MVRFVPPQTRYLDAGGAQLAYQVVGEGEIDLVYVNGLATQLDLRWESPHFRRFLDRLASFARVISFDRRGTGLSDPLPADIAAPTWEEWAEDLRLVLDAVGSTSAVVFAAVDAGAMAMVFAATYPERTRALILSNTSARILWAEDYPDGVSVEQADHLVELAATMWGTTGQVLLTNPSLGDDPDAAEWMARYTRASMTPRQGGAWLRAEVVTDVRAALALIACPTLILHSRRLIFPPFEHGAYIAEQVQGAELVELDSADTGLMFEPFDVAMDAVEEFLTGTTRAVETDRFLATVAFTDLVDSTRQAASVGDRRWRELIERHDSLLREAVADGGGRVWKSTGDGALATFDGPGRGIRALHRFKRQVTDLGLRARVGVHAGEVEHRGDDIGGLAVNIAARVMATAAADEIVVSRTVVDLVAGSALKFVDRGTHQLKCVPGDWNLYAVT